LFSECINTKFQLIKDPAINSEEPNYGPYISGLEKDVFIKWPKDQNPQFNETGNDYVLGYVWPEGKTVFPDFFKKITGDWWKNEIKKHYNNVLKFDGYYFLFKRFVSYY
jgi:hypothetical protein